MLSRKLFWLIGTISAIFIYSCEYQSDEVFYREVDKDVSLPDLTIDLNLASDTTYFYTSNLYVVLFLKLTNKEIYGVKFYVNNIEVKMFDREQEAYSISVPSSEYPIRVKAEIYTSTRTGSIADKVKNESFVIKTNEWVLIHVPEKPTIKSEIVDGRLKISWTSIKSSKRGKYYIYSRDYSKYLIDSTYNNWYIDSSYYGRSTNYQVGFGRSGTDVSGFSVNGDFFYPLPKLYINRKDSFVIYWEKSKFYNNIKGYRLRIDKDTILFNTTDTSFVYKNGVFGKSSNISIDLCLNDNQYYFFGQSYGCFPGTFLPESNILLEGDYFPLTGTSIYYQSINSPRIFYKFSLDTKADIASKPFWAYNLSISPNNKYILYGDLANNLNLLETNGLSLVRSLPGLKVGYSGIRIDISDVGTCVFYDYLNDVMIIYDILHDEKIAEYPLPERIYQFKISANGKYIFDQEHNVLFKVENNSCSEIWSDKKLQYQFTFFEFFPDNQEKICLYDGTTFFIKNCSDFSTIISFRITNKDVINIDFVNNKILANDNINFYIFSLTDGDILSSIRYEMNYLDRNKVRLFNNYLISGGCQLKLKY